MVILVGLDDDDGDGIDVAVVTMHDGK